MDTSGYTLILTLFKFLQIFCILQINFCQKHIQNINAQCFFTFKMLVLDKILVQNLVVRHLLQLCRDTQFVSFTEPIDLLVACLCLYYKKTLFLAEIKGIVTEQRLFYLLKLIVLILFFTGFLILLLGGYSPPLIQLISLVFECFTYRSYLPHIANLLIIIVLALFSQLLLRIAISF